MGAPNLAAAERRRCERRRCRIPVTLWSPVVTCDGLTAGDISETGIGLLLGEATPEAFLTTARWCRSFMAELGLPAGEVRLKVEIAWIAQVREAGRTFWKAGLKFVDADAESLGAIRKYFALDSVRRLVREIANA